jgi:hypothetical protein
LMIAPDSARFVRVAQALCVTTVRPASIAP